MMKHQKESKLAIAISKIHSYGFVNGSVRLQARERERERERKKERESRESRIDKQIDRWALKQTNAIHYAISSAVSILQVPIA